MSAERCRACFVIRDESIKPDSPMTQYNIKQLETVAGASVNVKSGEMKIECGASVQGGEVVGLPQCMSDYLSTHGITGKSIDEQRGPCEVLRQSKQ